MTKNWKCPNKKDCGRVGDHKIVKYWEGSANIDGAGHWHIECIFCGNNFNIWDCTVEKIKQMFGENYTHYL